MGGHAGFVPLGLGRSGFKRGRYEEGQNAATYAQFCRRQLFFFLQAGSTTLSELSRVVCLLVFAIEVVVASSIIELFISHCVNWTFHIHHKPITGKPGGSLSPSCASYRIWENSMIDIQAVT